MNELFLQIYVFWDNQAYINFKTSNELVMNYFLLCLFSRTMKLCIICRCLSLGEIEVVSTRRLVWVVCTAVLLFFYPGLILFTFYFSGFLLPAFPITSLPLLPIPQLWLSEQAQASTSLTESQVELQLADAASDEVHLFCTNTWCIPPYLFTLFLAAFMSLLWLRIETKTKL